MTNKHKLVIFDNISNREFLETHASAGRVGLVGSHTFIDKPIKRAQRALRGDRLNSDWSHAFIFQGKRFDEQHWVMESDLDIAARHVRFGVQENRIDKYFDEEGYPALAILDFHLTPEQTMTILRTGLDMVSEKYGYSIRELFGTLIAMPSRRLRSRPNLLHKERAFYCSAFVQHLFIQIAYDFALEADTKNTAPQHIFQTPLPHDTYILKRG